jgi:CHASE3 domain sensor protein
VSFEEATGLGKNMDKFEEMGRKLDEELTRLRKFVENDLAPETEKRTAQFLREVSEKLTDAATWLDARRAGRNTPQAKEPAA